MDLKALLERPPALHLDRDGRAVPLEVSEEVLRLLDSYVTGDSTTLETGAGLSTIVFALKGAHHTCVVPWTTEIERIQKWCSGAGVSMDRVAFHRALSEEVLPHLERSPLDVVLIDGAHGFPSPFIDWYYAGRRLRPGGILVVDDTHLWTGRVLRGFLIAEPGWELIDDFPMRSAVFRRSEGDEVLADWVHQPFVVRRSYSRGLKGIVRKAIRASDLARRQGLRALARKARRF